MIKQMLNKGVKSSMNLREQRVVQLMGAVSISVGSLLIIPILYSFYLGELTNGCVLVGLSLLFWFNLYLINYGYRTLSKIIIGYSISLVPFINLILSGRMPDGQYIGMISGIMISFICLLMIIDERHELWLYRISVAYFFLYSLFADILCVHLSSSKPSIKFLTDNYVYYKMPLVLSIVLIAIIIYSFKKLFYVYEKQLYKSYEELALLNYELIELNSTLEDNVTARTAELVESNKKIIDLAFIAAHEIRGPLSTILSVTSYLKTHPKDMEVENILPDLHDRSMMMDSVIRRMVSKLEGEIMEPK